MFRIKRIVKFISLATLCLIASVAQVKATESNENMNTYSVEGAYTVEIPADVTVPADTKTKDIPITAKLASNTNLVITISSANTYYLKNGENASVSRSIRYYLSDEKPLVFSNPEASETTKTYNLNVRLTNKTLLYSGDYTDTLTFTMSSTQSEDMANYHLKFDLNTTDTSAAITTTEKVLKSGEAYGTLPTPRRTGYDFVGWYTSAETQNDSTKVDENSEMGSEDVDLYAQWKVHTFHNTMTFWAWGLKNEEGNNVPGTAIQIGDDKTVDTETAYGTEYTYTTVMATEAGVRVPKGYELKQFGSATVGDTKWQRYSFDDMGVYTGKQPDCAVNAEYEYDPISYKITYDLDGGTNDSGNPSTYTVLYGVTFKEPTKVGYTFDGWYTDENTKITGINENCENNFKGIEDKAKAREEFYTELDKRTIGNITVKAHWKSNSEVSDAENSNISADADTMADETENVMVDDNTNQSTESEDIAPDSTEKEEENKIPDMTGDIVNDIENNSDISESDDKDGENTAVSDDGQNETEQEEATADSGEEESDVAVEEIVNEEKNAG